MHSPVIKISHGIKKHRFSHLTVGRRHSRDDEVASSDDKNCIQGDRDQMSERRINIKRNRHEIRVASDCDDSLESMPSPMVFHNYAKRRRFSETEDENYIR